MTENIKPEFDKNHTLAIPMSLSCKLDLSEYANKEPQTLQTSLTPKFKKTNLYVHFEGINPYCILLKYDGFNDMPISFIASFSLKVYNSKFNTSFKPHEVHYFLVNDITNMIHEIGFKEELPPYVNDNIDLIMKIPEKKKRAVIFSNHLRKNKKKSQSSNSSNNNLSDNKEDEENNNSKTSISDIIDDSSVIDDNNIDDKNTDDNNNDNNHKNAEIEKEDKLKLDDDYLTYIANRFNYAASSAILDSCSLKTVHDDSEAELLIQKGDYFSRLGDPKSASIFYWSAGIYGIPSLVTLAKLSGELSIIDRTRFQLLTHFPNEINKISTEKQKNPTSIKEAISLLSDPKKLLFINDYHSKNEVYFNQKLVATHPISYSYYKSSKKNKPQNQDMYNNDYFLDKIKARKLIKLISKTQPYIALKICLKYPEYTEFIPIPCRVEEVMEAFIQICVKQNYDNTMLFYFAELFVKNGLIARAMQIGYNISVLSSLPECAIRRACWVMLNTRQFSNLFLMLETYFKRCQNRSIGSLSAKNVYKHLMTVKKVNDKFKNTQRCVQTIADPLDPADLDFLCIVLDAACFLFLSGYVDDFKDILSAISTQNRKYFEKTGIPPEFDFYVFVDKASTFAVNDRIATESIFALGDEGTLNNAYNTLLNFEMVIPHPIPRMAIYDLRKGKKNLRKAAFWQQVRDCTMFHQILLVLGHYDILYTIPKLIQRDHTVMSYSDAINKIIEIYLHAIEKVHRILPTKQIFIHPLKFHNKYLDNQKVVFNNALKHVLPNYAVMLSENDCNVFYDNSLIVPWRLTL